MARPKTEERVRVQFDGVERKLLAQVKASKPEYEDLELSQVARMELRTRLFDELRKLKSEQTEEIRRLKNEGKQPLHNSPVVWELKQPYAEASTEFSQETY